MAISRDDVIRIATLARLDLDEAALDHIASDLDKIVGYVKKLDELDTTGVEPTTQVALAAPLREDRVLPGVARDLALSEAPRGTNEGFRVPGFVEES
jgi:aspartyl-tRNA(Asn)/glutamyl-tRNA(Gln) amidotransferase subunit C